MKKINVDYNNSLISVSNSLIKYYGNKIHHQTLKLLDNELDKNYQHIVLMLLDGLGTKIIEKNLDENSFIRKNITKKISSVFPPTTVAATTSLITGLSPIEHGWLGWHLYLSEKDPSLTLFTNLDYYQDTYYDKLHVTDIIGYKTFYQQVDNLDYEEIYPSFRPNGYKTFNEALNALEKRLNINNNKNTFTYFYWDHPDYLMHIEGTNSEMVKQLINKMNDELESFYHKMDSNTLLIIVADHGQIDIDPINLYEYQDILNCLYKKTSAEARSTMFYVKEEEKENFVKLFNQYFSNDYMLYTKEEILKMNLYGKGIIHPSTKYSMGNYIAISKTNKYFVSTPVTNLEFKGHHAGATIDELEIPLIILSKK